MLKYHRLIPRVRLRGARLIRVYTKSTVVFYSFVVVCFLMFISLRTRRLSKLKDLAEVKFEELNLELSRLPRPAEAEDSWKRPRIEDTAILSAYLETRPEVVLEEDSSLQRDNHAWAMIRIIGIIPTRLEKSRLYCYHRYRYKESWERKDVVFEEKSIGTRLAAYKENFGMANCAAHILCELPGRLNRSERIRLPYEVTVTLEAVENARDLRDREFVVVRYPNNGWKDVSDESRPREDGVAVCVQPLHHRFGDDLDLVAFVEFYRGMGVSRFTFYRDSVSPRVNKVLEHYVGEGIVTMIDWKLPDFYAFERNLRVDGIFAALNDCLYRSTFHAGYRYVAGVDVDEYIVPKEHDNFQQMMEHLNPRGNDEQIGAWIFRNVFFYLMHPDDTSTLAPNLPRLKLHVKTWRWRKTNSAWDRSKFIVQGRDIIDLGNHRVWLTKRSWSIFGRRYREVTVEPKIASSHHYRKCETKIETCWQRSTEIDRTAHRFTARVAQRVSDVLRIVFPDEASRPGYNTSLP
ncbi:uncharacterized protein [Venturia canescens]|uniref:uncharacterized protein n=1 Tax=Venturia canescens TaxID=32260 RepID=UPI001C9CE611|nr:uncharacterized protein LOC122409370 [Venturia canescens]